MVGCDAPVTQEQALVPVNDCISIKDGNFMEVTCERPIGEAYFDPNDGWVWSDAAQELVKSKSEWMRFTAADQTDAFCPKNEMVPCMFGKKIAECNSMKCYVKIKGEWIDKSKTFLYADQPDQYQPMRDKIEKESK